MSDMASVDRAFYELTVKQRDAAWLEIEQLKARLALLEARHERAKRDAEILHDSMRHLPMDQRIEHAHQQMTRIAEVFDFAAVVTLTPFDKPELIVAFRTPPCGDRCDDPRTCDIEILGAAGRFLRDSAERVAKGTMEGVDLKMYKDDLPQ